MRKGYLSAYFDKVAAKTLRPVEADAARSHQHELNGVAALKQLFGDAAEPQKFSAKFLYINDLDEEAISEDAWVTWYDARARSAPRTGRSEYRLYFPATGPSSRAAAGDLLIIGRRT